LWSTYRLAAKPICLPLLRQTTWPALALAFANAGKRSPAKIAIMAITTSNSMSVKALSREYLVFTPQIVTWKNYPLGQARQVLFDSLANNMHFEIQFQQPKKKRPGKVPGLWCVFSYLVKPTKLILGAAKLRCLVGRKRKRTRCIHIRPRTIHRVRSL